jgi:hypothetical protein
MVKLTHFRDICHLTFNDERLRSGDFGFQFLYEWSRLPDTGVQLLLKLREYRFEFVKVDALVAMWRSLPRRGALRAFARGVAA